MKEKRHPIENIKHKISNALLLFTNAVLCKFPSRHLRLLLYRMMGAHIGKSVIFRNTELLEPQKLHIGDNCSVGWHCLLDSRGGISIGNDVNISSYVKIITAGHDIKSKTFVGTEGEVIIDDYVWLATGCTILEGVHIGKGAVVACGAVVNKDVEPYTVVGGIPAKVISYRVRDLDYKLEMPPILF